MKTEKKRKTIRWKWSQTYCGAKLLFDDDDENARDVTELVNVAILEGVKWSSRFVFSSWYCCENRSFALYESRTSLNSSNDSGNFDSLKFIFIWEEDDDDEEVV